MNDKPPSPTRWGAFPDDWATLDMALGIGSDLLPVVSRPASAGAVISPTSSMKQLGKTPSRYDRNRQVVGIPQWTTHQASDAEISRWAAEADYGISVQCRVLKGFDLDITDAEQVIAIVVAVETALATMLPRRTRADSSKCLLAFRCAESFPKRVLKTAHGMIELLSNGQQFIAYGTHPSGARYEWKGAAIEATPEITLEEVDAVWAMLEAQFAIEPSRTSKPAPERVPGVEAVATDDPVADWLEARGLVHSETRRGGLVIDCPWQTEHTGGEPGDTSTVWFRAGTGGHAQGHFRCQHAHCEHRNRSDFLQAIGYEDNADDFEDLGPLPEANKDDNSPDDLLASDPFEVIPAHIFAAQPAGDYIIEDAIPEADLGMIYGASTDGKTFVTLDMMMAVARGVPWRGLKTKQGSVVYIVAEGGGGFRKRLNAYARHNDVDLKDIPFGVIHAAPNLLDAPQVKRICASILKNGARVIVVDTFAQTTPGANENAGEDVGKAIANIRGVGRKVGAMVILVHHTGKDASRGARGWSGLRAAADFELEVARDGENRVINTTKQKDGDDSKKWGFKLLEVPISVNDDGKVITSCVIVESDVQVDAGVRGGKRKAVAEKRVGPWDEVLLDTFQELAVGGDVLKTELVLRSANKRSEEEAGTLRDRKKNARRALARMSKGDNATFISSEEDDYVSLVR